MHLPQDNPLRDLPSVGELMATVELAALSLEKGRETVTDWVRQAVDQVREQVLSGEIGAATPTLLAQRVQLALSRRVEDEATLRLGRVINATGVVLHTSLGRAPLSHAAIEAVCAAAGACNLEVDLSSGERRYRGSQLQSAWRRLTGAEAALIVNNNAAATVLMLDALCRGREVVISRGQLIEIGGSFRLPEIFEQSGAVLREVGTTNHTRISDYERAIGPNTAAILRVHPSNYRIVGFAETPAIDELSRLARQAGVLCLDDLGSGCLVDTARFGLPHEPTFAESLQGGADLVLGSGDKLLGGPQCGILLGREDLLAQLRDHPLARTVRVDKLTLAALMATLDSYLRGTAVCDIPTLKLLAAPAESLDVRARQIRDSLAPASLNGPLPSPPLSKGGPGGGPPHENTGASGRRADANPGANTPGSPTLSILADRETSPVGGGSLPGATLPAAVLRLKHATWTAVDLARRLRVGSPRLFGRIRNDEVLLDLRSVLPEDDAEITAALRALEGGESDA